MADHCADRGADRAEGGDQRAWVALKSHEHRDRLVWALRTGGLDGERALHPPGGRALAAGQHPEVRTQFFQGILRRLRIGNKQAERR